MENYKNILQRIAKSIGKTSDNITIQDLLTHKFKLSDLQWLFMHIYEHLSKKQSPQEILNKHINNRFTQIANVGQLKLLEFDQIAFNIANKNNFNPIALSPVCILGTNSILTLIKQRNTLSTVRMIEVISDITTAIAIESAKKRKKQLSTVADINMSASHRIIRLQQLNDDLGFTPHFQMFGLCSLGRYRNNSAFEIKYLVKHIQSYLSILYSTKFKKYAVNNVVVTLSDMQLIESIISKENINREWLRKNTENESFNFIQESQINIPRFYKSINDVKNNDIDYFKISGRILLLSEIEKSVIIPLKRKFPKTIFLFDFGRTAGIGYYPDLCFKITAKNSLLTMYPLADGGIVDWGKKLLSDKKELMLTSGFGSELFCTMFKK